MFDRVFICVIFAPLSLIESFAPPPERHAYVHKKTDERGAELMHECLVMISIFHFQYQWPKCYARVRDYSWYSQTVSHPHI
jgi:hypothetical protein